MSKEQLERFWNSFTREYIGTSDKKAIKAFEKQVKPYAAFFMLGMFRDDATNLGYGKNVLLNLFVGMMLK